MHATTNACDTTNTGGIADVCDTTNAHDLTKAEDITNANDVSLLHAILLIAGMQ